MENEVDEALVAIEATLAESPSEDRVLAALRTTLAELRTSYARDATPFTPRHIARLRELSAMERALDDFVALRVDLGSLVDLEDIEEARAHLERIARALGPSLVRQRALKELRALEELRPAIEAQAGERAEMDATARWNASRVMHRSAPRAVTACGSCAPRGAPYWACSAYPACEHRQWLDRDARAFLEGDREIAARFEERWQREALPP